MEDIKIIEIPNFIKVKIVKINEKYCSYYVENYSNEYFYVNEDDFLKTHSKASISYTLSVDIPFTINIINVEHLENAINKLHKELTKDKIPRARKKEKYYIITSKFNVIENTELNDNYDNTQHRAYNYFTSESKARVFATRLQDKLIDLWKEELKNEN